MSESNLFVLASAWHSFQLCVRNTVLLTLSEVVGLVHHINLIAGDTIGMNKVDGQLIAPSGKVLVFFSSNSHICLNLDTQPTTAHARLAYQVGLSFEEATINYIF